MMTKRLFIAAVVCLLSAGIAHAQRFTDKIDRGLVAVPTNGMFLSWRKFGNEYYDTKYNLYRNGSKIASNLDVTNYQDASGNASSTYQVEAIVNGQSTGLCEGVKPWGDAYFDVKVKPVVNRSGKTIGNSTTDGASTTSGYTLNDVSLADVDGDGITEFIVKRNNSQGNLRQTSNTTDFNLYECYKLDGTRLWWIDLGPNLMAGPDEQWDMIGCDWNMDGKAEVVMRGADNMIIHTATGKTINVGDMSYDNGAGRSEREEYTHHGKEYLLYLNGETGEPMYGWDGSGSWTPEEYPLPRFEQGEAADVYNSTSAEYAAVWGEQDTGHRSCKHYFGAPYIDGERPYLFLGRGAYTRHKMCVLDLSSGTPVQLWRWNCYDKNSAWYGNGFHNYQIADVDMDGRDEIVFGSMIIDDNGMGLCTTGLGHGDAQHVGDLDPYRWGLEQFTCQEGSQGNSYWNATTGDMYYRKADGGDDGRALAGNFTNEVPGGQGRSVSSGVIGLSSDKVINTNGDAMSGTYANLNMRIFWDGDLLDEILNSTGGEGRPAAIFKWGGSRIWSSTGAVHNNSSKCNPSAQGDILGDWREELVLRTSNNSALRIFTTTTKTNYGIYTLWHDHQYRNAMVWQCVGYNQPPRPSFFLGELEDITIAPPPLMNEGRTLTTNISTTDEHLLVSGYQNQTVSVDNGASPWIVTVNTPAVVAGTGSNQATRSTPKQPEREITTYTTTFTGGALSGATRLVKQGEGVLVLNNVEHQHTGETNIWQGTLQFDGKMASSPVWLNRHTTLISNGGQFLGGLKADYNATIYPGGKDNVGSLTASTLKLGFGSRVVFDVQGTTADQLNATTLTIETKTWANGPKYKAPVFEFTNASSLAEGSYMLGTVGTLNGNLDEVIVEGINESVTARLSNNGGQLMLVIGDMRDATTVVWNGTANENTWDLAQTQNFLNNGQPDYAAVGDDVVFDDNAASTNVVVKGAVRPHSVTFNNETKAYTISGDSIVGGGTITKNGAATVTFNNWNHTGATIINGGTMVVNMLANNSGQDWGSLGNAQQSITVNDGATLRTNGVIITDQKINVSGEATVDVPNNMSFTMNKGTKGSGATLVKTGNGTMSLGPNNTIAKLVIKAGRVNSDGSSNKDQLPANVEFQGGTLWGANMEDTPGITNNANFEVPQGKTGTFYASFRGVYNGKLTGAGTFNVYTGGVRCYFDGDWSEFTGTIVADKNNRQNKKAYDPIWSFRNSKGLPNAMLNVSENVRVSNEGKNIELGKLGGKGTLIGKGQWILGSNNQDFFLTTEIGVTSERTDPYGGTISKEPSNLTKRGTGKMTIMTLGKLNATMTIEGGTVSFNQNSLETLVCGTNATTIKDGGRIVGQGRLNTLQLQSGGTLVPCGSTSNETTPGTIKTNALLNVQQGAVVNFLVGNGKNSQLQPQMMTFNGTLKVTLLDGYSPKSGDEFTLWTVTNTFSGTPVFELPQLPDGLYWNTDGLKDKTGVLRITGNASDGIGRIGTNETVEAQVFTTGGMQVGTIQTRRADLRQAVRQLGVQSGIYIVKMQCGRNCQSETVVIR